MTKREALALQVAHTWRLWRGLKSRRDELNEEMLATEGRYWKAVEKLLEHETQKIRTEGA